MVKGNKTLENRNQVKFYVRTEHMEEFKKFCDAIEKDEEIIALRYNKKLGLMSIALMQLIIKYNDEHLEE